MLDLRSSRLPAGRRGSFAQQPQCSIPDRARVEPTRVERDHLVEELPGGGLLVEQPDHILEILPGFAQNSRIIEQGLDGLAGPGHFFDLLAEDITVDYVVTVPGYPRHIEGRAAVAELYRPYGTMIILDRCFDLAVYHDAAKGVVVLEYASEGHLVSTGRRYSNRYISVLTLREGEVAHWRDYLDPVAVFDALGWPPR